MNLGVTGRLLALALFAAAPGAQAQGVAEDPAQASYAEERKLARIFAVDAATQDSLDPLNMLQRGEAIDPQTLGQLFTDALDRKRLAGVQASLAALGAVDRARLSEAGKISYDSFAFQKREDAAWLSPALRRLTAVRPMNHFSGLHVDFPAMLAADGVIGFDDEADYRLALDLNRAFPAVIDNAVARFRQGKAEGLVESRLTVINMIGQIDALLAQPAAQSPFLSPVQNFPPGLAKSRRPRLRKAFAAAFRSDIQPAYRRLRAFLADEYLPAARAAPGIGAMPGGDRLYRALIERHTTMALDPGEVHRLGETEVARISHEMEIVKRELGFTGPLPTFFEHIRTDPRFHPTAAAELEQGFETTGKQVAAQIPRFFNRVPKTPLELRPYPEYRAKYEAGAGYQLGTPDASRAGVLFYNTYDLPSRFLSGIATLYLHEGAPGHHFQISLAQEDERLPAFQRLDGNTAFVEGWALYAETLGYEMGLYADPMQHWGTLDDEMLRAMRLVVDTGLHAQSWSREQAITYMLTHSGMGQSDATAEVERYIANPGQALAYKIGALTIQRLRRKAEAALGKRFDVRAFHDSVLGSGALPLPILEAKIDRWIAAQK